MSDMNPNRSAGTVLIVEDNPMNMELVTELLRTRRYAVLQAFTAMEGIKLAEMMQPDLVLMDISLPEVDGLTATRRLREEETTRHLPIIALTAHAMREDRDMALAAGCDDYLSKPFRAAELLNLIERVLRRRGRQKT